MEYFTFFPQIVYNNNIVTDITKRIDIINQIKDNVALFQYVQVQDGQRPEDIAYKYYGDSTLFWIVLYINDIVDPYLGWLFTDEQLMTYIKNKYGVDKVYSVHHYETIKGSNLGIGIWVDFGTPFSTSVSNYDYEFNINEQKRKIKVLKQLYVQQVLNDYKNAF